MISLLLGIMVVFLVLGFPMLLAMLVAPLAVLLVYYPAINPTLLVQQIISGMTPFVLLTIPMFIFAADVMGQGKMADRLLGFVGSLVGHVHGGMAITAGGTCTIFGAISGSGQATLVAVGKPMFKPMAKLGYSIPHVIALLMNNATIAILIPPSMCMILFCISTGVSVGEMFMAGFAPGLLMFVLYGTYEYFYARYRKIQTTPRMSFKQILTALKEAIIPLGFPVIVLGGIYSGFFSPTESAAVSCIYAIVCEMFIYRSLTLRDLGKIALSTGLVTGTVLVLAAAGQAFSWLITYARLPQVITEGLLGSDPSGIRVLATLSIIMAIACMFVDSVPVIIIMAPIFYPVAVQAGGDPIHLGIVFTIQAAIGCVTPPFGCNIFTACGIFNQSFMEVIKGLVPYLLINILISVILIFSPEVALLSRNLFYG